MKLVDISLTIDKIALDPNNPRDNIFKNKSQDDILQLTLGRPGTRELLRSMNECIRWVNKIVVVCFDTYKEMFPDTKLKKEEYNYIAVEGNTRLSCLKSNRLNTFNSNDEVPVVEAVREVGEPITSFMESILITQGIANVMVVKQWSDIAKAKHIFDMYKLKMSNSQTKNADAIKKIISSVSEELGMKHDVVRKAIQRYTIYSKIQEDVEDIPEEKWGYLEAFEINADTRSFIGLNEDYTWDEDKAEDVLSILPNLINNAFTHNENAKMFRDNFRNYIAECIQKGTQRQDIIDSLQEVLDSDDETKTIKDLLTEEDKDDNVEKTEWEKTLKKMLNQLQSYPVMQNWASEQLDDLKDISKKIQKMISYIELENEQ